MATKEQVDTLQADVTALIDAGTAEITAAVDALAAANSADPAIAAMDAQVKDATQHMKDAAAALAPAPVSVPEA